MADFFTHRGDRFRWRRAGRFSFF